MTATAAVETDRAAIVAKVVRVLVNMIFSISVDVRRGDPHRPPAADGSYETNHSGRQFVPSKFETGLRPSQIVPLTEPFGL